MELEEAIKRIGVLENDLKTVNDTLKQKEDYIKQLTENNIANQKTIAELMKTNQDLLTNVGKDNTDDILNKINEKMSNYLN